MQVLHCKNHCTYEQSFVLCPYLFSRNVNFILTRTVISYLLTIAKPTITKVFDDLCQCSNIITMQVTEFELACTLKMILKEGCQLRICWNVSYSIYVQLATVFQKTLYLHTFNWRSYFRKPSIYAHFII